MESQTGLRLKSSGTFFKPLRREDAKIPLRLPASAVNSILGHILRFHNSTNKYFSEVKSIYCIGDGQ